MKHKFENIADLLTWHQQHYPLMQAQDVYKLLFQSAMGAEHLIENWDNAKQRFFNECEDVRFDKDTAQLCDPVSLDGEIVRLNLRKGLVNFSSEMLWDVFLQSVKTFNSDFKKLHGYWNEFINLVKKDMLSFDKSKVDQLHQKVMMNEFPVMHHSQKYREHYRPAYRIVNIKFLNISGVVDE